MNKEVMEKLKERLRLYDEYTDRVEVDGGEDWISVRFGGCDLAIGLFADGTWLLYDKREQDKNK